jgi:sugar phosphate isomerase/epimerase
MKHLKIGVRLESLALPLRKALGAVSRLGVAGVQIDAVGDLAPDTLSQTGRREFRNVLRGHGLELTALGCPLRRGLDVAENQERRLEHVRKVMSLAWDLGPGITVVEAGQVPDEKDLERTRLMRDALSNLGVYGDRNGTKLALETGLESGAVLAAWLRSIDSGSLAANLDPANLLLHGFDPVQAARDLREKVVHTHARDCRKASTSRAAQEVPLGYGDIDWMTFVETLEEIEYRGWLTIERESGDNRLADVERGIAFLRRMVGEGVV